MKIFVLLEGTKLLQNIKSDRSLTLAGHSVIKLDFKIQTWVKHNKTLITQNPVSIFQI